MSKFFIHPNTDKVIGSPNPYVENFADALSQKHQVVNRHAKNRGVFNFYRYLSQTDIYVFNWIEDLPQKKYGRIQTVLFIVFTFIAKLLGKQLVWVLHNKYSHHKAKDQWTDFMYRFMMKHSDIIITHSNSGVEFAKENFPQYSSKIRMLFHPIQPLIPGVYPTKKKYDLLIWGSIFPYKGILEFLKYASERTTFSQLKILVVGRCKDREYKRQLQEVLTEKMVFIEKMLEMDEIAGFSRQSRFTLFTYKSPTVISSGSLMDSIRMGASIIGPDHGAFKDLEGYGFMKIYRNYEDIASIVNDSSDRPIEGEQLDLFFRENSWDAFVPKFEHALQLNT